jgi:hypothetical protein
VPVFSGWESSVSASLQWVPVLVGASLQLVPVFSRCQFSVGFQETLKGGRSRSMAVRNFRVRIGARTQESAHWSQHTGTGVGARTRDRKYFGCVGHKCKIFQVQQSQMQILPSNISFVTLIYSIYCSRKYIIFCT